MESFVSRTLKSALLEITDAKYQYSISKWFFLETWEWVEQNVSNCLPPSHSLVEDTLKSLSVLLSCLCPELQASFKV